MAVICSDGDLRLGGIAVGNKKDKFVVFPRCDVHRVIVGRLLLDVAPLICSKIDFFAIPHDFTMRLDFTTILICYYTILICSRSP